MASKPTARSATKLSDATQQANAQALLVEAAKRLDLTDTVVVCQNAAVHPSLPGFLTALAASLHKDADRHQRQQTREHAKRDGVPFPSATLSSVDTSSGRGAARMEVDGLAECRWVSAREHLLIHGPTQSGKSYVASVLAKEARARGHSVMYRTTSAMLAEWHGTMKEGASAMTRLSRSVRDTDLLILDNFGEGNIYAHDLGYLRELITERFDEEGKSLCIVSSGNRLAWESWMSQSDEGRAVSARIANAFNKVSLLRGPK